MFHKLGYGGAPKMVCFMANQLALVGYDVSIFVYRDENKSNYKLDDKIHLFSSKNRTSSKILELISVTNAIRVTRPDLIISFMSTNSFYSWFGARLFGSKLIVSERGDPFVESKLGIFSKIKLKLMNFADGGIFQTKEASGFFSMKLQNNSLLLPNPISPPKETLIPFSDREARIAFVGRFETKQKRHDLMLESIKLLVPSFPDIVVDFYGDGPDYDAIVKLSIQLGIQKNVKFHGKVDDISYYLCRSKYFVLASDYEGIPNALIEAMSCGCAVVSTDCSPGGARLVIKNRENGLLSKKGCKTSLARSLKSLLESESYAKALASQAQRITDEFSENKISEKLSDYVSRNLK